jgi:predicted transposase YbfD/YdcC
MAASQGSIAELFADLPDPRLDRNKKHRLDDILTIALCAVLSGADTWAEVEFYGRCKEPFLRRFLELPHGIPSHDTFNRVFALLDPGRFAECFGRWMAAVGEATGLVPIAIDGKAVRGAPRPTASGRLHLVTAWATANGLALGQQAVADHSNEVAAVPELLRLLDLRGTVVTLDAAGCQRENAAIIRERGGHYVLAVKWNQPALHDAVRAVFERACGADFAGVRYDEHATEDDAHGRHEERYVTVIYDPDGVPADWPDVAAVVLVGRERVVNGVATSTAHHYLTSYPGTAAQLAGWVRGHWGIENGLHWVLDVAFREDDNRTRDANAGANLGLLRRIATTLLKQMEAKGSIKGRRRQAGWDDTFLIKALQGIPAL